MLKKIISYTLVLCLWISLTLTAGAESRNNDLDEVINDTAVYLYENVKNPQVSSIGGEWTVMGLARSSFDLPNEYYQNYYETVEEYVKECGGVLHSKKYTEYSRVIIALTAIGKDPANVGGYNLLTPLGDYDKTVWQGLNGPIWALLALDCGDYEMPQSSGAAIQATRDMYISRILEAQLPDGGFSLLGYGNASVDALSDTDITGMALQALAKYTDREDVGAAVNKALIYISEAQNDDGGFSSWGSENSESSVQIMTALCELGISLDDPRFVKNGNTVLDNVLSFYRKGSGFLHVSDKTGSNLMATEQAFYGIVAAKRLIDGKNSLYRMSDHIKFSEPDEGERVFGLPGKNENIRLMSVINPGITFSDISAHKNQSAIEALAARGIINGKSKEAFDPESCMTRAEFATITVKALGLEINSSSNFIDTAKSDWFYGYVNTAYDYGIVSGVSAGVFNPEGTITREEAAVMTARAAALCGLDSDMEGAAAIDVLCEFADYIMVSDWAMASVAVCYDEGILSDDEADIEPHRYITRAEVAQMLFNMLGIGRLL